MNRLDYKMATNTLKNSNRKFNLKAQLQVWEGRYRLSKSEDYQLYLKPLLMEAFNNLWPDPTQAKSAEEFHKQYSEAWGKAMAYKELYNLLNSSEAMVEALSKQIKNPDKDFSIE